MSVVHPLPETAGLLAGLAGVGNALAGVDEQADSAGLTSVDNGHLGPCIEQLADLRLVTERLVVRFVIEAACRGSAIDEGSSLHDWVAARVPWWTRSEVSQVVTVARASGRSGMEPVVQAVADGELPVRRAARLVSLLDRVAVVADTDTVTRDAEILTSAACDPGFSDRKLRQAGDHLLEVALPEHSAREEQRAKSKLRGVNESSLADGQLTRFVITCEDEGAAMLRAVLDSPLAAPAPDDDGLDERTASQRRYDALVTVLSRGMSSPEGVPTTSKASIMVTVPFDALAATVGEPQLALAPLGAPEPLATKQLPGVCQTAEDLGDSSPVSAPVSSPVGLRGALTVSGQRIRASTLRKIACEAGILPAVLGGESEVLDLGRTARLATPGQHRALWHRDEGCTYPGCTIPSLWCQAHHNQWWSRGGGTDIKNLALLCQRHHTLVHQRDFAATITDTSVTWHR